MCVSFQYTDRVTVLHLDDAGLSIIRQAINETWKAGISMERSRCGSGWSFKLSGQLFIIGSNIVSQQTRQMVCLMLQRLYGTGWRIIVTSDLGRLEDKSTLFFQRCPPESSTIPFVCVGLSSVHKLQILNLPPQLVEPIKETIRLSWSLGIKKENWTNGVLEVKLFGYPWKATKQQSVMAKVLLQNIIGTLRRYQWVYYCNVNLKSTADSLFFRHDPSIPPYESVQFCTISLNLNNRLRVINAPGTVVAVIRKVIETTWLCGGIQADREYHGSREFKLSGNPWHSIKVEAVMSRCLILKILEAMREQGWHNIAGIDISRGVTDKSTLIFQKGEPKRSPVICLSLNDVDKFRLINMPGQLVELFRQILLCRWPNGVQEEKKLTLTSGSVWQMKLFGRPWNGGESNDTIHARSFLCNIIQEFIERGWRPFLSADVSAKYIHQENGPDYPVDVHSMWFVYDSPSSAQPSASSYGFSFASSPAQYGVGRSLLPSPLLDDHQTSGFDM